MCIRDRALALLAALSGVLFPAVYDFAGGDAEWDESGASRLVLIGRVIDVALRNPITGLGPAAYRPYAATQPLVLPGNRLWIGAVVSSHNNYVDLFAHVGLVGLALFGWFVVEIGRLGHRLRQRYASGFAAAYVNGMLAAGVGALVIMALADWILPFVYNIGFQGFQASVLVWLFLGGLVALEDIPQVERQVESG
ncbi:MAG: O-antigen ligase family protein [Anaerolinea sp.]|nr:O-antigen ligase family protein [Anaerolinea sp.]